VTSLTRRVLVALLAVSAPASGSDVPQGFQTEDWNVNEEGTGSENPETTIRTIFESLRNEADLGEPEPLLLFPKHYGVTLVCDEGYPLALQGDFPAATIACVDKVGTVYRSVAAGKSIFDMAGRCEMKGGEVDRRSTLAGILAHELGHLQGRHPILFEEEKFEFCRKWAVDDQRRTEVQGIIEGGRKRIASDPRLSKAPEETKPCCSSLS